MLKNSFKKIALSLTAIFTLSTPLNSFAKGGEYPTGEILSFGSSLSQVQEDQLRAYFNAPDNIEAIYVTSDVAIKQLGLEANAFDNFTGGWYSSAYVKLNSEETGVNVTANNLTLVTDDMLANALITSGILNADVIASSPFPVTGESALAGILAGAEQIMGSQLKVEGKQAAQKEIEVSLDLAEEIGATEATAIINEIKTKVIKDNPSNEKKIKNIVNDVEKKYDVQLTEEMKSEVVTLMSNINNLDLDYSKLKDTLNKASSKFQEDMKSLGKEIKESGIIDRFVNWFKNLWSSIFDSKTESNEVTTPDSSIDDSSEATDNTETSDNLNNPNSTIGTETQDENNLEPTN